ncbi:metalloprotease [Amycolatopsis sp. KNN50.9b]|nr:metalloprotease [Amycolatopsis sp. KNN50.9b]
MSAVVVLLAGLVVFIAVGNRPDSPSPTVAAPTSTAASGGNAAGAATSSVDGEKILALASHPILQNPDDGLQNFACELPEWRSDQASAEAFFTAADQCLNQAWGEFLERYHLPFTPPTLHFPTGTHFTTACGTIAVSVATAAYYCDDNLYVPFRGLQTDQYGDNPGVYLALFAHEYGHHVQEVAGIMDAVWQQIYAVGQNSPAGLELSRRKELQAQCFSGMFLGAVVDRGGSVTRDMYAKAWRDQDTRGDNTSGSSDHGTNAHYAQWWRTGAQFNRIAKCNTFAAPAAEVR